MSQTVAGEENALEAIGIEKAYAGPAGLLEVLRGVDLKVRRGTVLANVGVSGAGKSTLLNILGTLDRPDRGTLSIRGHRVDGTPEEFAAYIKSEVPKWAQVVKASGARAD